MKNLNDFANAAVPEDQGPRFKWAYLTNVEVAVAICVPVFMFGASLGQSLGFANLLLALGLGGIILSLLAGWSSYIGVKTRLSTALLVKGAFGSNGAKLVWLVLALSLFGWFGVQTELFAKALIDLCHKINPDWTISKTIVIILSGLLMSSTAIVGIKGVGKLAQISVPLLLGVMVYAFVSALVKNGLSSWFQHTPQNPMPLGTAIAAIVGAYSVGAIVMPDVKRFAIDKQNAIFAAILSLGVFYPVLLLLTAVTSVMMSQPDFMTLLLNFGLGAFSLVILMLATWTTNDVNLYGASLSLTPLFPNVPRQWLAGASGVIGTAIACFGLFENMMSLFMLLGVLTTPLLAIYSFYYLTGRFANNDINASPPVNWIAFTTWLVSSFIGILSTPSAQWGFGLIQLTTVPALDSLIASLLLCSIVYATQKRKRNGVPFSA